MIANQQHCKAKEEFVQHVGWIFDFPILLKPFEHLQSKSDCTRKSKQGLVILIKKLWTKNQQPTKHKLFTFG